MVDYNNAQLAQKANKVGNVLSGLGIVFVFLSILAAAGLFIAAGNAAEAGNDYYSEYYYDSTELAWTYAGMGVGALTYGAVLWAGFALGASVARYIGTKHAAAAAPRYPAPTATAGV